ncbi:MAG: DUF4430 domain-containing protein [Candidatus Wildermuthbacteria bacterium]|nr:DUF4430 domain-containing protein [Candidatus Wildermuthbacteria bacterium]
MIKALRSPKTLLFISFVAVFALGLASGFLVSSNQVRDDIPVDGENEAISVSLKIDYGNGDVQAFASENIVAGNTVWQLLQALERRHGIILETRNFAGVGIFVEGINGIRNTNTQYWQYWVNGEYAKVGAGQYKLKNGDEVLWKRTSERP